MTKKEAKAVLSQLAGPFVQRNGFELPKGNDGGITFLRKTSSGVDRVRCDTLDFGNRQVPTFVFSKRIDAIEHVYSAIHDAVGLSIPPASDSSSIVTSYGSFHRIRNNSYMPECSSVEDLQRCVDLVEAFFNEAVEPLLDLFNDIRYIDRVINNSIDFWDIDQDKGFSLGGEFHVRRLIVARMSGRQEFESVAEKNYEVMEKLVTQSGSKFLLDKTDKTKKVPYTVEYLRKIDPLYASCNLVEDERFGRLLDLLRYPEKNRKLL
jgi:hypothetical protein